MYKIWFHSNTTLVKVKYKMAFGLLILVFIQIQHLLKLNRLKIIENLFSNSIQIQHLLKLNIMSIIGVRRGDIFKYNTC